MNVLGVCKYQHLQSGKCNVSLFGRMQCLHIQRGLRLFFYWLQALRRPMGAWRTSDLHAFFIPLLSSTPHFSRKKKVFLQIYRFFVHAGDWLVSCTPKHPLNPHKPPLSDTKLKKNYVLWHITCIIEKKVVTLHTFWWKDQNSSVIPQEASTETEDKNIHIFDVY